MRRSYPVPFSALLIALIPSLMLAPPAATPSLAQAPQNPSAGEASQAGKADAPPSAKDVDALRRAVQDDLDNVALRRRFAQALLASGRPYPAIDQLEEALRRAPDDALTHQLLGTCYRRLGKADEALASFRRALELDGSLVPARGAVASILADQGDLSGAIAELDTILEQEPDRFGLHLARADLQIRTGHPERAEEDLARAVELRPDDVPARIAYHAVLVEMGRYGEARSVLESGLQATEGNAVLSDALARLLALCPDESVCDPARALAFADSAYRAESTPVHAATLALALAASGRFDEAVQIQSQLLAAAQKDGAPEAVVNQLRTVLEAYQRGERPGTKPGTGGSGPGSR